MLAGPPLAFSRPAAPMHGGIGLRVRFSASPLAMQSAPRSNSTPSLNMPGFKT